MKKYEVELVHTADFCLDKTINNIISRRQEKGWEFVPPIINASFNTGEIILTFVKREDS